MRMIALTALLFISTPSLAQETFVSVCDRHPSVKKELTHFLKLKCEKIAPENLLSFKRLWVEARIGELRARDFQGLTNLKHLRLENTYFEVAEFPLNLFEFIRSITSLIISNADFLSLPKDTFSVLGQIYSLQFNNCQVGAIQPEFFAPLSTLKFLNVPANAVLNLPYPQLKNLSILSLSEGSLSHLSKTFFNSLSKLGHLSIKSMSLENVPHDIFSPLSPIRAFRFEDVDLSPFAKNLVAWPEKIDFVTIRFSSTPAVLPIGVFDQSQITINTVILQDNPTLEHIPDNFFLNINDLKFVDVSRSPLSKTSKSAFRGVLNVVGLPTNFGATETGGTSEGWTP